MQSNAQLGRSWFLYSLGFHMINNQLLISTDHPDMSQVLKNSETSEGVRRTRIRNQKFINNYFKSVKCYDAEHGIGHSSP